MTQLEKELIKESDELFKKQGKRPPLNEKLTELQKIQQEIYETERKEREHQHLYKQLEDIDQTIESLKVQEHEIIADLNYYEKLNQVKSPVVKHQILTDEMNQFKRRRIIS
nr:hypothetical protein [Piscibacillus salipiscarius]